MSEQIPPEIMDIVDAYATKASYSPSDYEWIRTHVVTGYRLRNTEVKELKENADVALKKYIDSQEQLQQKEKEIAQLQSDVEHNANRAIEIAKERDELNENIRQLHISYIQQLGQREARIRELEEALRKILALNNGREEDGRTSYTECGLIAKKVLNKQKTDIPETATLGCGELKNENSGI